MTARPTTAGSAAEVADLRRASADLGVALADHPLEADVAAAIAAWVTALARRLGHDWGAAALSPVVLMRAHGVVGARLAGAQHVAGAAALAATARTLRARLESRPGDDGR